MRPKMIYAAILGFIGFVTSFGAHIVTVNLPAYAKQVGVGLAMIGLLIAAYDFAEIIAKPIFGTLADRRGMKQTMMVGIVVFIVASLLYLVLPPSLLLLVRFLQGVGAAALSAVSLALVAEYFDENRGQAYGIYNAIKGAGYVVSPLIGGFLVVSSHFRSIFIASALVGLAALALAFFLPRPKSEQTALDDDDFSWKGFMSIIRSRELLPWFVVIVVNMFLVGVLFGFLPVRLANLGYTPWSSGVVMSVVAVSYLLIQPIAGRIADTRGSAVTVKVGLFFSALALLLMPFVQTYLLVLASVIAGIGIGIVWTNTDTLVSKLAKKEDLAQTVGIAGSFKEFGDMTGPLLIGILAQAFGLASGFIVTGALGLLSAAWIARRRASV